MLSLSKIYLKHCNRIEEGQPVKSLEPYLWNHQKKRLPRRFEEKEEKNTQKVDRFWKKYWSWCRKGRKWQKNVQSKGCMITGIRKKQGNKGSMAKQRMWIWKTKYTSVEGIHKQIEALTGRKDIYHVVALKTKIELLFWRKWQSLNDGQNTSKNYCNMTGKQARNWQKHKWTKDLTVISASCHM